MPFVCGIHVKFKVTARGENRIKTNKLRGLSPRANYTDRANAACRRS
jgi:hypothetical protein